MTQGKKQTQQKCPVCGERLRVPAVAVETISSGPPTFFQKVFRTAPKGVVVYACGAECAQKVKSRPGHYLMLVLNEINSGPVLSRSPELAPKEPTLPVSTATSFGR